MLSSVNRSLGMEGVVQYDFGKTGPDGRLVPTGFLNALLPVLLNAMSKLPSNRYLGQGIKSQSTRSSDSSDDSEETCLEDVASIRNE